MIHRVNSIYRATEGEGIFLGIPQVFVRYQGCKVGCLNCDSKDTWSFRGGKVLTTQMIIDQCKEQGFSSSRRRISITGGDPLDLEHIESVFELIKALKEEGAWINIEAAGDKFNQEIFSLVDFISFDVKTPSTGVQVDLDLLKNFIEQFSEKSQIKSVVFDKVDFKFIKDIKDSMSDLLNSKSVQWVITPVFNYGEKFPQNRYWNLFLQC